MRHDSSHLRVSQHTNTPAPAARGVAVSTVNRRSVPAPPPPPSRCRDSKHLYYLLTQNQPVYVYFANLCLSNVFWETKPNIICFLNSRSLKQNVLAKIYSILASTSVQLSNKDRHNDRQQPPATSHQAMCNVLGSQEEQNIFTEAMTTLCSLCYLTPVH